MNRITNEGSENNHDMLYQSSAALGVGSIGSIALAGASEVLNVADVTTPALIVGAVGGIMTAITYVSYCKKPTNY